MEPAEIARVREHALGRLKLAPVAEERRHTLSSRELEVLALVAEGYTSSAIGLRLFVTEETVKTHVSHVLARLNACNRAHAVALGFRLGLLPRDDTAPSE